MAIPTIQQTGSSRSRPTGDKSTLTVTLTDMQEKQLLTYATQAQQLLINQFSLRGNLEDIDRLYQREQNWTQTQLKAMLANRDGQAHKIQDITVPIVMPQVESALAYFKEVFLTGYPIFGVASDPANEDAALQIETIIAENSITARWARQLLMYFRDGLKYNLMGVEVDWQEQTNWTVETDLSSQYPNSAKPKQVLWKGNVLKRMDPYNSFFDPRVSPAEIHEHGEFAGYITLMSRVRMKKYFNDLFGSISPSLVVRALQSAPVVGTNTASQAPFWYYQPSINPWPTMDRNNLMGFNWLSWANGNDVKPYGIKYNDVYQVTTLYARIIPSDFGLNVPSPNTPQVWKMKIVNGQVIVVFERMTNVHNFIPIFFAQPIEDGLDFQTKSFATNVADLQQLASSMMAGYMASKRKMVGDRMIYDPTRIREKDINNTNPAAKIPVRPAAYGKPIGEAVYSIPYNDEAVNSLLTGTQLMVNYANTVNRQNPAQQGQFVKGNKTLHEFQDTMGHSNDGNALMAMSVEVSALATLKEVIKLNILQYQTDATLFNRDKQQQVQIKVADIRTAAVVFKMTDGELPQDKVMSTDGWSTALTGLSQIPGLAAGYNISPLFSYILKIQEDVDIAPFQKSALQQQFDQQNQVWQQVAMEAIKAGQKPPPQPVPSPALQQEQQAAQQNGGTLQPAQTTPALQSTQGPTLTNPSTGGGQPGAQATPSQGAP